MILREGLSARVKGKIFKGEIPDNIVDSVKGFRKVIEKKNKVIEDRLKAEENPEIKEKEAPKEEKKAKDK
jgi:hypothetical protein